MKRSRIVMATTHVDRHFERLAPSSLKNMATDMKQSYLPLWLHHDPRIPPIGRVVDADIEQRADGEFALVGVVEQFEGDEMVPYDSSRRMKIESAPEDLTICFDRSYRDERSRALIDDIAKLLGTTPQPSVKKALEPVSILTFTVKTVFGGMVAAIAKKTTEAAWEKLRPKLALLLGHRRKKADDYVFQLKFVVVVSGNEVEVDLLATCPGEKQLVIIFGEHVATVEAALLHWLPKHPEIRRVVFDVGGRAALFSYAVRSDVVVVYDGPRPPASS